MTLPRKDQFQGCLIGLCLGDALGFPVEGYPPLICQRYTEQILQSGLAGEWTHYPFVFGQYSDDSQLTRELILSLLHCERFNPEDYARRIAELFQSRKIVGQGKATEAAAKRLLLGFPWTDSGIFPPAAGNGSAMRASPLGLFYFNDPEKMLAAAHDQSRITHRDPRCSAGSITLAGAVALALQSETIEPQAFLEQLSQWARTQSELFADNLINLQQWLELPLEEAFNAISQTGVDSEYAGVWQGISPFVLSSVLWSLWSFLKTPEDYWQTLCTAIRVGGDVDTTAAMAGAISGAHLGLDVLPEYLMKRLIDQGTWGHTQLLALADKLYTLKVSQLGAEETAEPAPAS